MGAGNNDPAREERIRVVVRLRPVAHEEQSMHFVVEGRELRVRCGEGREYRFGLDKVYGDESTQTEIFEGEGARLMEGAINDGLNGLLMAYGQTGSGKTHTILGDGSWAARPTWGLVPRAMERLFELAAKRRRCGEQVEILLSCIEVYNETLIDLLGDSELTVSEGPDGVRVKGLTMVQAASAGEALQLLTGARVSRTVSGHAMNLSSSRSHLVVVAHCAVHRQHMVVRSKLHFVDLAGSERTELSAPKQATTIREACFINKSLTFLEQVVVALAERRDHIPFRSSKLTHLLKDSLAGEGPRRTSLIACLWPSHLDQSLATLRFAARMGRIVCHYEPCHGGDDSAASKAKLATLRAEIDVLRRELAVRDLLSGTDSPQYSYAALSASELARAQADAHAYIADPTNVPPIVTFAQVKAVYAALRQAVTESRHADDHSRADDDDDDDSGSLVAQLSCVRIQATDVKRRIKRTAANVNEAKRAIDTLRDELDKHTDDDERRHLHDTIRGVKAEYRSAFHELGEAKSQLETIESTRRRLQELIIEQERCQQRRPEETFRLPQCHHMPKATSLPETSTSDSASPASTLGSGEEEQ